MLHILYHNHCLKMAAYCFMQLLAICGEGHNIWFCSSYVGHHTGIYKKIHYSESALLNMQVNVFFMVLALHTLLKAKRHSMEWKSNSTSKSSIELGRLVLSENSGKR